MKNTFLVSTFILLILITMYSCNKEPQTQPAYTGDTVSVHTIEGYIYKTTTNLPVANLAIALSQNRNYSVPALDTSDVYCFTDSVGHFILQYRSGGTGNTVALYARPSSYQCVFGSLTILDGLEKGKDYQLGKIYSPLAW